MFDIWYLSWRALVFLALFYASIIDAQQSCILPSTNFLEIRLENLVIASGGEGGNPMVSAQDAPHYTCQVQGTSMGTYQKLSVAIRYTTASNPTPRIAQFELDCISGGLQERAGSLSNNLPGSFMDYVNLGTFTNCSECHKNAGNDNHCIACDSACNVGLMRCTGSSSSDCCAAFETNDVCRADLDCNDNNFIANEQNNFTCACGLFLCADGYSFNASSCACFLSDICVADNPCANNGACRLGSSPDQYTCDCIGTFNGTNCTECSLSCVNGYKSTSDCTSCELQDFCIASSPCQNGGSCMLGSSPDQYTCDCTGTNYSGTDCADCSLKCDNGYLPANNCKDCLETDVCEAFSPCQNGATCMSRSSGLEYTCQCTNYYTGLNCTECSLQCLNNGTVDRTCESCDCVTGYTGRNCSDCATGYLLSRDGSTCDPGTRLSKDGVTWWHVVVPIIAAILIIVVITGIITFVYFYSNKNNKVIGA